LKGNKEHVMDFKVLLTTFAAIFLAEFGDKTQLATLSLSAESKSPFSLFLGCLLCPHFDIIDS